MASHPTLPLIRHLSRRLSPHLAGRVSANAVTLTGTAVGLLGVGSLLQGAPLPAAVCIFAHSLCDHCDGEVARLTRTESLLGDRLSEFSGWIVYSTLFLALGTLCLDRGWSAIWLWFAIAAALGATLNFAVALALKEWTDAPDSDPSADVARRVAPVRAGTLHHLRDWAIFALRHLAEADFWLILLVLAAFDALWLLLPAAAIGAQLYWMTALPRGVRSLRA